MSAKMIAKEAKIKMKKLHSPLKYLYFLQPSLLVFLSDFFKNSLLTLNQFLRNLISTSEKERGREPFTYANNVQCSYVHIKFV